MSAPDIHGKPLMTPQLHHIALLLEAILAELRYARGLSVAEEAYRQSHEADFQRPLSELQGLRRELF